MVLIKIPKSKQEDVKNMLSDESVKIRVGDDEVPLPRLGMIIKDGEIFDIGDYIYLYLECSDEVGKAVEEVFKDICAEMSDEERDQILKHIKNQDEGAIKGFGDIFG